MNEAKPTPLQTLRDYIERSTHWREGGATRHDALLALKELEAGGGQGPGETFSLFEEASAWARATGKTIPPDAPELLGWLTSAVNAWQERINGGSSHTPANRAREAEHYPGHDSMGMPLSCGKPLCREGEHHPLCEMHAGNGEAPAVGHGMNNAEINRLYASMPPSAQQDARGREAFRRLVRVIEGAVPPHQ